MFSCQIQEANSFDIFQLPSPCDIADFIRTGVIEREKAEEQNDKMVSWEWMTRWKMTFQEGKIAKLLAKYNVKLRRMKREAGKVYGPDERDDLEIKKRYVKRSVNSGDLENSFHE